MIHAWITIKEINYEKSFASLFPMVMKKCNEMEQPNLAIRFLNKMGNASMTAMIGILNCMEEKYKNELVFSIVEQYCTELPAMLNTRLQKDEVGRNIHIGGLDLVKDENGYLAFVVRNVQVDYSGLVKNNTVKQKIGDFANGAVKKTVFGKFDFLSKIAKDGAGLAVEAAVAAAPNTVEKKVLDMMNKKESKYKLLVMVQQELEAKGIFLKLKDFMFTKEELFLKSEQNAEETKGRKFKLSPELEEGILDAVAGYLKSLLVSEEAGGYPGVKEQN
ncbi:MAG: hypothetical protein HFI75_01120 [Lachnospiraceae bacterium]|nr:hypothetical protein [Lachnospiraceae bacterium]